MILNYKEYGEGEKVLFIAHGLFGSLDNWATLGRRFADEWRVILVDQRNHGQSFHDPVMDYDAMAGDLIALMDELKIKKAQFIGHSMGGKTLMRMAMISPERIEKMIIADIGPQAYPPHHDIILEAMKSLNLEKLSSRSAAEDEISLMISDRGVVLFLLKNLHWVETGKLGWRMNLPVLDGNMDNILGSVGSDVVQVPTLFIRGGRSGYIKDEDIMDIQMQFPQSEVLTIPGVGHWLHAEAPEEFYRLASDFLN